MVARLLMLRRGWVINPIRPSGPSWAVWLIVLSVASGCASTQAVPRLLPSPRVYERDIPLPTGFRIVDKFDESRTTGNRRLYLRHVYEGSDDRYAVRNFYDEQMPLMRWVKVSGGSIGGEFTSRFEKENESCTVEITDAGWGKTSIRIIIAQEERAAAPPKTRDTS